MKHIDHSSRQALRLCHPPSGYGTHISVGKRSRRICIYIHRDTSGRDPFIYIPFPSSDDTLSPWSPHGICHGRHAYSPVIDPFAIREVSSFRHQHAPRPHSSYQQR